MSSTAPRRTTTTLFTVLFALVSLFGFTAAQNCDNSDDLGGHSHADAGDRFYSFPVLQSILNVRVDAHYERQGQNDFDLSLDITSSNGKTCFAQIRSNGTPITNPQRLGSGQECQNVAGPISNKFLKAGMAIVVACAD